MTTRCLFHFNTPPNKLSQASKDDQIFMLFYNFYQTVNSELDEILGKNVSGDAERNAVLTALKAGAGSGAEFCKLTRIIDCFQDFTDKQDSLTADALTLYGPIGTDIPFIAEIYNNLAGLNYFTAKVASNPTEDCSPYKLVDLTDVIKHTFDDSGIREIIVKCFDPLLTKKLDDGVKGVAGLLKTNCDVIAIKSKTFTGGGKRKKRTASKKASSKKASQKGGAKRKSKKASSKKGSKKASKKASQKGGAKRRSKKAGSKKTSKKAGSKKAGSKKTSMKGGAKRRSKKAGSKKAASKKKASSKKTSMKGGKRRSRAGSKKVASKKVASKKVASKKTVSKRKASKKASSKKASMKGGKRRSRAGSKKSSKKGSKKVASKKRASKKGSKSRTRK